MQNLPAYYIHGRISHVYGRDWDQRFSNKDELLVLVYDASPVNDELMAVMKSQILLAPSPLRPWRSKIHTPHLHTNNIIQFYLTLFLYIFLLFPLLAN